MLGLLLLQVLASCLCLGHSEVMDSFSTCSEFFYKGTTPNEALQPSNPARICQFYINKPRYATLYDRDRRIPVYSAYKYQCLPGKRPEMPWLLEPQLINRVYTKEMSTENFIEEKYTVTLDEIAKTQAINQDYKNLKDLDRGHLSPSCHQKDDIHRKATFTLTNIVPQNKTLNQGAWKDYESKTMREKIKGCETTYVITGAVPGEDYIKDRVNVPSYIWSAACCEVKGTQQRKAWGAIAENNKNKVEVLSLEALEQKLSNLYRGTVTLFNNAC
ncbi:ENDD1 protein, partial [Sylvietta virens]|nr:ENDD1 protein [Sylvietta virens]